MLYLFCVYNVSVFLPTVKWHSIQRVFFNFFTNFYFIYSNLENIITHITISQPINNEISFTVRNAYMYTFYRKRINNFNKKQEFCFTLAVDMSHLEPQVEWIFVSGCTVVWLSLNKQATRWQHLSYFRVFASSFRVFVVAPSGQQGHKILKTRCDIAKVVSEDAILISHPRIVLSWSRIVFSCFRMFVASLSFGRDYKNAKQRCEGAILSRIVFSRFRIVVRCVLASCFFACSWSRPRGRKDETTISPTEHRS